MWCEWRVNLMSPVPSLLIVYGTILSYVLMTFKLIDVWVLFKRFYNWTVLIVVTENVLLWSCWVGDTNCEVKEACFKHKLEFYALVTISEDKMGCLLFAVKAVFMA